MIVVLLISFKIENIISHQATVYPFNIIIHFFVACIIRAWLVISLLNANIQHDNITKKLYTDKNILNDNMPNMANWNSIYFI